MITVATMTWDLTKPDLSESTLATIVTYLENAALAGTCLNVNDSRLADQELGIYVRIWADQASAEDWKAFIIQTALADGAAVTVQLSSDLIA